MRTLALVGLFALVLGPGCAPSGLVGEPGQHPDSLRADNARLRAHVQRLQDSLQLRADVRTGQYARTLRQLQDQINRLVYEVRTLRDGGQTVRVLSADDLFEPGTATLSDAGIEQLQSVIAHLEAAYPNRSVRVEGHADPTPLSEGMRERFDSNWELSAARATAVVRHLISESALGPAQFGAVAYGATHPLTANDTAAGRRRNRRVRIAVLPAPRDYSRPFETSW